MHRGIYFRGFIVTTYELAGAKYQTEGLTDNPTSYLAPRKGGTYRRRSMRPVCQVVGMPMLLGIDVDYPSHQAIVTLLCGAWILSQGVQGSIALVSQHEGHGLCGPVTNVPAL